jgi:hypothetical protein
MLHQDLSENASFQTFLLSISSINPSENAKTRAFQPAELRKPRSKGRYRYDYAVLRAIARKLLYSLHGCVFVALS